MREPVLLPVVDTPVACSLDAQGLTGRMADWRRVLAGVTGRADGSGRHEVVLELGADTSVPELAQLCADEVACCPFFTFDVVISATGVQLRVAVPPGAEVTLSEFAGLLPNRVRAGST